MARAGLPLTAWPPAQFPVFMYRVALVALADGRSAQCRGPFHPCAFASVLVVVVMVPTMVLSRALSTPPLTNEPMTEGPCVIAGRAARPRFATLQGVGSEVRSLR
jgi:hypothetical protein